jgi:anti-anti-sigma regulatory factor
LDVLYYPTLRALLLTVPPQARRILVDLSETSTVDSTCLAELIIAKRRWEREGRRAALVVSNQHVYKLMSMANVLEKLKVFEDRADATRYLALGNG